MDRDSGRKVAPFQLTRDVTALSELLFDSSSVASSRSVLVHSASAGKKNCLQSVSFPEGVYSLL